MLWRLHWEPDLLKPSVHPAGRWRFDAPAGEYQVTYGNTDAGACFAEVYGDTSLIPSTDGGRQLSLLWARRPLQLITLDEGPTLAALDIDGSIATTRDYAITRAWSEALHAWYPHADGIRYLGRKAAKCLNYCFFLDRCGNDLEARTLDTLDGLAAYVQVAADRWSLSFGGFGPGGARYLR